jgi:hypothetical protein
MTAKNENRGKDEVKIVDLSVDENLRASYLKSVRFTA